jgi:hypothetical protein
MQGNSKVWTSRWTDKNTLLQGPTSEKPRHTYRKCAPVERVGRRSISFKLGAQIDGLSIGFQVELGWCVRVFT